VKIFLSKRKCREAIVEDPGEMSNDDEVCYLAATELVRRYKKRTLSPVEVTEAVLRRIERLDPHVNAFTLLDRESALKSAQESERRWANGEPLGLVDGVPTAIKDLILTKGWPTLRGSLSAVKDQVWAEDSPATARLREHGAVLFGKTTTAEFGWKGLADCPASGITRNPWNLAHTPGGSSGGSAAGAALGLCQLHVATDGGGSGRMPAAHSGAFGFKQTFGRVSVYPYSQNGTLFNVTPLTRSVGDAALLLDVIARPDPRDWNALPASNVSWSAGLDDGVAGLRVAFSPALGYADVDPEISRVVADAVKVFSDLGCIVDQVDPGIEDPFPIFRTFWAAGAAKLLGSLGSRRELTELGLQDVADEGAKLDAVSYVTAMEKREALGRHFIKFHQDWDLLVTPMTAEPPSQIVESSVGLGVRTARPSFSYLSPLAYPFNLTQQPAATIPCGLTSTGLPVGLQIVAAKFGDAKVLRAARAFEKARPFGRPKDPA
jgi:aspartyl-tRNA(Asn)/glutamyl-tRNA(Gln) amidotransferase subunit A